MKIKKYSEVPIISYMVIINNFFFGTIKLYGQDQSKTEKVVRRVVDKSLEELPLVLGMLK